MLASRLACGGESNRAPRPGFGFFDAAIIIAHIVGNADSGAGARASATSVSASVSASASVVGDVDVDTCDRAGVEFAFALVVRIYPISYFEPVVSITRCGLYTINTGKRSRIAGAGATSNTIAIHDHDVAGRGR